MSKCDFCNDPCGTKHCVTERTKIYDPPSGWKYGFPKEVPHSVTTDEDFTKWLIDSGYPEKDIELALRYGRRWFK